MLRTILSNRFANILATRHDFNVGHAVGGKPCVIALR